MDKNMEHEMELGLCTDHKGVPYIQYHKGLYSGVPITILSGNSNSGLVLYLGPKDPVRSSEV